MTFKDKKHMSRPDYHHLNEISLQVLSRGYLKAGVAHDALLAAAVDRLEDMIEAAENILGFPLPTLRHGAKRGWFSPSSPVWSNFGAGRALPISCNGSYMDDNLDSILWKVAEVGAMTGAGAGTSVAMSALRPFGTPISKGGESNGPVHFARLLQEDIEVVSQSSVRRGSCCIYLNVDHPDIEEWLKMRSIAGGVHHKIQHLDFAVGLTDEFMEALETDPKGSPRRNLMAKIRNKRRETGRPFIFFPGNANRAKPQVLKDLGIDIHASNLCTEIMLPSSPNESFVCNLSSANLLYYDEWKNTPFIREMIYFLDAVMSDYIDKIEPDKNPKYRLLADAHRFAVRWRALGLGTLGYHSLLKSKMIPFESEDARALNIEVHKYIHEESIAASRWLAEKFGEPEGMKGYGMRNLTVNAIAPTQSSSVICGQVSKSIEPEEAVVFENDAAKVIFTQYCPIFREVLQRHGKDTADVWRSVMKQGGRVDHLDFLTDLEKEVFKPWIDIDQHEVVRQGIDRGVYVDQGQSMNIVLRNEATMKDDIDIIRAAWRGGLKSLYYRNGENAAQKKARENACVACEA